jgi:hypothetical protein
MPGIVTGSPIVAQLLALIGCGAAVSAIGRAAYRAARRRDCALARETMAAAAIVTLAAAFIFHREQPRRIHLPAQPAEVRAPAAERLSRREFSRRAEQRAADERQRFAREDEQRRLHERQEREALFASVVSNDEK